MNCLALEIHGAFKIQCLPQNDKKYIFLYFKYKHCDLKNKALWCLTVHKALLNSQKEWNWWNCIIWRLSSISYQEPSNIQKESLVCVFTVGFWLQSRPSVQKSIAGLGLKLFIWIQNFIHICRYSIKNEVFALN